MNSPKGSWESLASEIPTEIARCVSIRRGVPTPFRGNAPSPRVLQLLLCWLNGVNTNPEPIL